MPKSKRYFSTICFLSAAVWPLWPAYLSLVACLGLSSFFCHHCTVSVPLQPFAIFYFLITSAMFVSICWYWKKCSPSAAVWLLWPSYLAFVAMLLIWSVSSQYIHFSFPLQPFALLLLLLCSGAAALLCSFLLCSAYLCFELWGFKNICLPWGFLFLRSSGI